mgnify:CR=1 FL=1
MSKERKTLNVVGHSKLFYSISCALIAIFIILTFVIGLNVAIEFKGGTVLTYTYEGDIKTSDVSNTVSDSIGDKCTVTLGENTGNAGKTGKACGGNNSPRAPLIPPRGFAAAAGQGEREDCAREERRTGEGRSEGRLSTLFS